jgi:hypothetical protein
MPKEQIPQTIGAMVSLCATMYCGMQKEKMLTETIQESVRFVFKNYSFIGVQEIREAFSLAAANTFEGVNMTAFFGTFTISMLGDILSAYQKYRNPIIYKAYELIIKEETKIKEEGEKHQKNAQALTQIEQDIEQAIIAVQSGVPMIWESWHDVPVHYAEIAVREGWVEISAEMKKVIWEKAKAYALRDIQAVASDLSNFSEAKQARISLRTKIEAEIITDPAKRIYSKLLIFEYIKMHEL